ncbi:MAG: phosphatidylinositol-specific phospholipase C [Rhodospirillaceae bacterium]|nr:phosphatidylinositol-specific phospholipase C [Rhodospirillaceae bacterium]
MKNAPENPPADYARQAANQLGTQEESGALESISICLGANERGWLELTWSSTSPDKWDWVGIFPSLDAPDDAQETWKWVSGGAPFVPWDMARPGVQARYMRWDEQLRKYVALRRTPPIPSRVSSQRYPLSRWMSYLPFDDVPISCLNLPGTHDSGAYRTWVGEATTQNLSIPEQLSAGIRFLDIRLKEKDGKLALYHGPIPLSLTFSDVLTAVADFIAANPLEFIVMSVKNEERDDSDGTSFASLVRDGYLKAYGSLVITDDTVPSLRAARGRIVLMRRYKLPQIGFSHGYGLDFSSGWANNAKDMSISYRSRNDPRVVVTAHLQDYYDTDNVVAKFDAISKMIDKAIVGPGSEFYINFSSASSVPDRIPYQMAMAINPRLSSDLTRRASCIRFGWFMMDFPDFTTDLIYTLVTSNDLSPLKGKFPQPARHTPASVAEILRSGAQPVSNGPHDLVVGLGPSERGWMTLYWQGSTPGTWDWIGLYAQESDKDTDFIQGNNWQWASRSGSTGIEGYFVTEKAVSSGSGYHARYLVWDETAKLYRSIARTPPYIVKVCSSA